MRSNNRYDGIDSFTIKTVRTKARELTRTPYFSAYEQEDLEQELIVYLLTRLPLKDFMHKHSKAGVIKKLVDERAIQLIRNITFKKRKSALSVLSLQQPVTAEDAQRETLLIDIIPDSASFYEEPYSHDECEIGCQIDIRRTVENMQEAPGSLRLGELCELLQTMSVTDISKSKGISRETIYQSLSKIRQVFLEADLKIYA